MDTKKGQPRFVGAALRFKFLRRILVGGGKFDAIVFLQKRIGKLAILDFSQVEFLSNQATVSSLPGNSNSLAGAVCRATPCKDGLCQCQARIRGLLSWRFFSARHKKKFPGSW